MNFRANKGRTGCKVMLINAREGIIVYSKGR